MLLKHLLKEENYVNTELLLIRQECSSFLIETDKHPVFKLLPTSYGDLQKVKVRQHKKHSGIAEVFNKAFKEYSNLTQRAVFTYGSMPELTNENEPFYVFPINGYKYLYSKEVTNSKYDYQTVLSTLSEQIQNNEEAVEIMIDLLKYTYLKSHLREGIKNNSEIIFYNIPYYYAIRVKSVINYENLIHKLHNTNI